jgi:hypothetical protein
MQGDVVPSRVPAPRNITEIGGYLNLLGTLKQADMRLQVLAGILGIAGPNPAPGWIDPAPPLTFVPVTNDRPAIPNVASIPVSVPVRSDFVNAVRAALDTLHSQGCMLPLFGTPAALPAAGTGLPTPSDVLPYVGRTLNVAAMAALRDPANDVLVLARAAGGSGPFALAARASGAAASAIAPGNYEALQCTDSASNVVALTGVKLVWVDLILAAAGFYPAMPLPQPSSLKDTAWARYTNVTGLIAGTSRLADELALLYAWTTIAGSVFSGFSTWIWNGTQFASAEAAVMA